MFPGAPVRKGDLVITTDIPFALSLVNKKVVPRRLSLKAKLKRPTGLTGNSKGDGRLNRKKSRSEFTK